MSALVLFGSGRSACTERSLESLQRAILRVCLTRRCRMNMQATQHTAVGSQSPRGQKGRAPQSITCTLKRLRACASNAEGTAFATQFLHCIAPSQKLLVMPVKKRCHSDDPSGRSSMLLDTLGVHVLRVWGTALPNFAERSGLGLSYQGVVSASACPPFLKGFAPTWFSGNV